MPAPDDKESGAGIPGSSWAETAASPGPPAHMGGQRVFGTSASHQPSSGGKSISRVIRVDAAQSDHIMLSPPVWWPDPLGSTEPICLCMCGSACQATEAAESNRVVRVYGAHLCQCSLPDPLGSTKLVIVCVCARCSNLPASGACTCHPSHQHSVLHNDQPPPVGWTVSLLFLQPLDRHQREQEPGPSSRDL